MLGPLAAFLSSCTWALGSGIYSRLAERHSSFAVNGSRALMALPLFFVALLYAEGGWGGAMAALGQLQGGNLAWLAFSMFCSYAFADTIFFRATHRIGVPSALAIASCYPLWSAGVGALWRGEDLSPLAYAGLLLIVAGVVGVILAGRKHQRHDRRSFVIGVALATLTSLLWAINTFAIARGSQGLSLFAANIVRMGSVLLLCPLFSRLLDRRWEFALPRQDFVRNVPLFAMEAFGGSLFFIYAFQHAPLAVAAALSSLAPVVALPIAWFTGSERPSLAKSLGIACVVTGIYLLLRP